MLQTARRSVLVLVAATLLAGCATAAPRRTGTTDAAEAAPRRCSTADPDRWAWFCVVGQILYGAASFFTPVNELTMR